MNTQGMPGKVLQAVVIGISAAIAGFAFMVGYRSAT